MLLDDVIRAEQQRLRDGEVEDLRGLLIDDELVSSQARQMLRRAWPGRSTRSRSSRTGDGGYRLSGEPIVGRLLPTDVFRAIEAVAGNNTPDRGGRNGT